MEEEAVYGSDLARVYDTVYAGTDGKDYAVESAAVAALVLARNPHARRLLDVACGTGEHLKHLRQHFAHVEGLEISGPMRRIAAAKLPGVPIHDADMRGFALEARFDAITCLFSAIGYMRGRDELNRAIACMAGHLRPAGVMVIEPWFTPGEWRGETIGHLVVRTGDGEIIRLTHATNRGCCSVLNRHYLVARHGCETVHFEDRHEMTLFTDAEYCDAFTAAGCGEVEVVDGWAPGRRRLVATLRRLH